MRSFAIISVLLLLIPYSYGQLTIKPAPKTDSYLYVKGTVLFVEQDVNLQKNADASPTEASIYLRKDAQLIQGEGGNAVNSGNGLLSVFQEGTSNAYDYNYWSSPVSEGLVGNGKFGIKMFYAPLTETKSQQAGHSSALDGKANPLVISNRWIFTYSGTLYSDWNAVSENINIPVGYGFTMKGVNGQDPTTVEGIKNNPGNAQRYDFRGRPNNGPVPIPLTSGEYTLIGNPFPSALDLSLFLIENSGTGTLVTACGETIARKSISTGIAYFWDSMENGASHYLQDYVGGYGAFSPVDPCTAGIYERPIFKRYGPSEEVVGETGEHYDRRFLPIAQGFMVQASQDGELIFENHHRTFRKEGDLSQFKQNGEKNVPTGLLKIPKIRLEALIDNSYTRYLTLAFWPSATSETDPGMDAAAYTTTPTDIGVIQENMNYVIDVRAFAEAEEIPLYLKVDKNNTSVELKITGIENFDNKEIYILDSLFNIYFPLTKVPFRINLEKGIYHHRFKIAFQNGSKVPDVEEFPPQDISVLHNPELNNIEIINSRLHPLESVAVFDLLGRLLYFSRNVKSEKLQIPISNLANSLYIVRIITEDQRMLSKKVNILINH